MPAELFPTRYRALSHGLSAAAGKFGSVVAQLFLAYISYGHGINYNTIQKWLPYSLLIFSIFMILGLVTTVSWIPSAERGPTGEIKNLEELEVGRETPNGFAQTKIARIVERCWRLVARVWDKAYLAVDSFAGGDEKERRAAKKEEQREREMNEIENTRTRSGIVENAEEGEEVGNGGNTHEELGDFVNGHAGGQQSLRRSN
jgi:PHS family inorganic phosphate transporter-like MFS transporter